MIGMRPAIASLSDTAAPAACTNEIFACCLPQRPAPSLHAHPCRAYDLAPLVNLRAQEPVHPGRARFLGAWRDRADVLDPLAHERIVQRRRERSVGPGD